MKKVTAITIFDTAVGTRASIVYSEINDDGVIVKDNIRLDRIIVDKAVLKLSLIHISEPTRRS